MWERLTCSIAESSDFDTELESTGKRFNAVMLRSNFLIKDMKDA